MRIDHGRMEAFVRRHARLFRFVQTTRRVVILGPWRNLVVNYYQWVSSNSPLRTYEHSLFPSLDVDKTVHNIHKAGYSLGILLPEEHVCKILEYCESNKATAYHNPHVKCEAVNNIAFDVKVVDVVRKYIGAEPVLNTSCIYWLFPPNDNGGEASAPSTRTKQFHYDVGDFRSLNVFVYLTDVDRDCGPHVIIENTHRYKSLPQIMKPYIDDDDAYQRYPGRIKVITGKKGTGFFEELTSYHKHLANRAPRLILVICYLLQRKR